MSTEISQLPIRDIHLPAEVAWWPPGPGWWLMAALVAVFTGWFIRHCLKPRKSRDVIAMRRQARKRLRHIAADFNADNDRLRLAQSLSALMRILLIHESQHPVAGITGTQWLKTLDQHFGLQQRFHSDLGQALTIGAYNPKLNYDPQALIKLIDQATAQSYPAEQNNA